MSDEQLTGRTYSKNQYRKGVNSTRRKLETIYNKKKILAIYYKNFLMRTLAVTGS